VTGGTGAFGSTTASPPATGVAGSATGVAGSAAGSTTAPATGVAGSAAGTAAGSTTAAAGSASTDVSANLPSDMCLCTGTLIAVDASNIMMTKTQRIPGIIFFKAMVFTVDCSGNWQQRRQGGSCKFTVQKVALMRVQMDEGV